MKAITCLIGLFLLFLASPAKAQSDGDEIPWSINTYKIYAYWWSQRK